MVAGNLPYNVATAVDRSGSRQSGADPARGLPGAVGGGRAAGGAAGRSGLWRALRAHRRPRRGIAPRARAPRQLPSGAEGRWRLRRLVAARGAGGAPDRGRASRAPSTWRSVSAARRCATRWQRAGGAPRPSASWRRSGLPPRGGPNIGCRGVRGPPRRRRGRWRVAAHAKVGREPVRREPSTRAAAPGRLHLPPTRRVPCLPNPPRPVSRPCA